mmetsp:Transcript_16654/g.48325  ORF Transcript_16654/g.48325 Transcript_16654/m.48325 type:complete len:364 (+) Transcript_16654:77-1168(+)
MVAKKSLLLAALCAGHLRLAFGAGSADDGVGDCAADDSALLQRSSVPDLGSIAHEAQDIATGTENGPDAASRKANALAGAALAHEGDKVNTTLAGYAGQVHKEAAMCRKHARQVRRGMASLLSKAFNVSMPRLNASSEDEDMAKQMVERAAKMFESMVTALERTTKVADRVPARVANLSGVVNASLERPLMRCRMAAASFGRVRRLVERAPIGFAAVKARAEASSFGAVWKAVLEQDEEPEPVGPSSVMAEFDASVREARDALDGLRDELGTGFASLSTSVQDTLKDKVDGDVLAKVKASFDGDSSQAQDIADGTHEAFGALLDSISEGAKDTGIAPNRGLLAAMPGVVSLVVALSALLSSSM